MSSEKPTNAVDQKRSLESRLSWLGGIIDGEGMITAIKRSSRRSNQLGFAPRVSITNTDPMMIEEVVAILQAVGLAHHVQEKAGKGTWKRKYEVLFVGFKRCSRALPILIPYLVVKRGKAEILLALCKERLKAPRNGKYTAEQVALALSLRERGLGRSDNHAPSS